VGLARFEPHLFLGVPKKQPQASLEHVERVLDVVVIVPGHLLARPDLELRDPEARPLGVPSPALDLVEMTRVLHRVAFDCFHGAPPSAGDGTIAAPSPRGDRQWLRTCWKPSRMESPWSR